MGKALAPLNLFRSKQDEILNRWLQEIHSNPHFSGNRKLEDNAKFLLGQILHAVESQPILDLWQRVLQDQGKNGFSTKDTALLIFSLKKALSDSGPEMEALNRILDLLGLFTFEAYSAEKEQVISRQTEQIQYLQSRYAEELIGTSPQMKAIFKAIGLVLENDVTVLIQGETGTGKELIAHIIHHNSKRKAQPMITVNCGAIPRELIESELFGHEKGAFTSAEARRLGKFELAQDGTIFLDEIGELPLDMQVKLLHVLQNREFERVGGTEKIQANVRVIAATNKNLKSEVEKGRFRADLFYRLNVFPVTVPPLRERKEDIVPLAQHFIGVYARQFNVSDKQLSGDAKAFLLEQAWEGNIRELENVIQRAVLIAPDRLITGAILQLRPGELETVLDIKALPEPGDILPLTVIEKEAMEQALKIKGNIRQAAKALGISRTTFYAKAKKYHLPISDRD